jgi:hypothetical protein
LLVSGPVFAAGAATPAPSDTTGYADFYSGIYSGSTEGLYDTNVTDAVGYLVGGDGFSNTWLGKTLAAQFDGNFRGYTAAGGAGINGFSAWNFDAGAHLAYRDPDKDAAAVFGALDISNGATFADVGNGRSTAFGLLGAEGQAYLNNVTLYLQGGVALPLPQDVNTNGAFWQTYGTFAFVRGVLRYFPTDNIRLQAEATYAHGTIDYFGFMAGPPGVADVNILNARLEADYRPDGSNASYFAAVEGTVNQQTEGNVTQQVSSVRLLSGVIVDFGQDTLKARDRKGVTWDLPRFGDMMQTGDSVNFCNDSGCVP